MPHLCDGESLNVQGSANRPYILKNVGGVYSCTCPAWRNQSLGIENRTCKHLRKLRGDAAEEERLGGAVSRRHHPHPLSKENQSCQAQALPSADSSLSAPAATNSGNCRSTATKSWSALAAT